MALLLFESKDLFLVPWCKYLQKLMDISDAHMIKLQLSLEHLYVNSVCIDNLWNTCRCSLWAWTMPRPVLHCVITDLTRATWVFRLLQTKAVTTVCGLCGDIYQTFLTRESQPAVKAYVCNMNERRHVGRRLRAPWSLQWCALTAPLRDKEFSEILAVQPKYQHREIRLQYTCHDFPWVQLVILSSSVLHVMPATIFSSEAGEQELAG